MSFLFGVSFSGLSPTLTPRFASPAGVQVIRPLQHVAVPELGLHDHVGRPAAHRQLPAAENHRQRQLRQGQTGTTRPHRERGERARLALRNNFKRLFFFVFGGKFRGNQFLCLRTEQILHYKSIR